MVRNFWKTDGTAAGTVLVKDIIPSSDDSQPFELTHVNGTLFFSALRTFGTGATQWVDDVLWKSDGTAEGTVAVQDGNVFDTAFFPEQLTHVDGLVFFNAFDFGDIAELWRSDGTSAGTVQLTHSSSSFVGSFQEELTPFNGMLFFAHFVEDEEGFAPATLWKSDGTVAGTSL